MVGSHQKKSLAARSGKNTASKRSVESEANPSATVSLELQQKCLDIFRDAFSPDLENAATLQEVKGHLYRRDFATAFGKEEYLRVYASRWSPSRALGYLQLFEDLDEHLALDPATSEYLGSDGALRMVFLGGGAGGELIAAGGWLKQRTSNASGTAGQRLELKVVDIADWSNVVSALETGLKTPPVLSKYASQSKKDANAALLDSEDLKVRFHQLDILEADETALQVQVQNARLVTFMFTLNELYSTSVAKTQQLLLRLKACMAPGARLLVVDSPGSYSTVSINGAEKRYPMMWLLQHTMLASAPGQGDEHKNEWKEVLSHSSKWFRLSPDLRYPIELENMRFQLHLFTKSDGQHESSDG